MSEKPAEARTAFENYEVDGILKSVADVALGINIDLKHKGYNCSVYIHNNSLLIMPPEGKPISLELFNTLVSDYKTDGVAVSFNQDEQIIRVSPVLH